MKRKNFKCPNGCDFPVRKKTLQNRDNIYTYDFANYNYCPCCGNLMPNTKKIIIDFFNVYNLHPDLGAAKRLLLKSEYESAARETFVVVEKKLRQQSKLDLHGANLVTQALGFKYDNSKKVILEMPQIAVNDLSTESKRNEQDGLKLLLMGFFRGQRNLYQHNSIGSGVSNIMAVIIEASFILYLLDGHSITEKGHWIKSKTSYEDIYQRMPKMKDRIRFRIENRFVKKRKR